MESQKQLGKDQLVNQKCKNSSNFMGTRTVVTEAGDFSKSPIPPTFLSFL